VYAIEISARLATGGGPTESKRFDYVIVGGGSAGAVLGARLSEDATCSVLVLEAGPAGPLDSDADLLSNVNFALTARD